MIERLCRWILRLYPRDFRERFGDEMLATARSLDEQQPGMLTNIRALVDFVTGAIALHLEPTPQSTNHQESSRMESFLQDLRFAARGLRRDPAFALFAIITLGIGIGANAAMFGIVDRLLLRGPDLVREPDRVARIYYTVEPAGMRRFTGSTVGQAMLTLLRDRAKSFSGFAAYANNENTLGRGVGARRIVAQYASGDYFSLLGAQPAQGRFFGLAEDDRNGAARVVVISDRVWRRDFGGSAAIGQTLIVGDQPHTVIGIAPRGFTGAELEPVDVWLPMNLKSPFITSNWATTWNAQWMNVVGRLADGVTRERANAELTQVFRAGYTGTETDMKSATITAAPLNADDNGSEAAEARVARWLMGVALVILLIVCANVVNLLLARSVRRAREIAIRLALGAGAARLRRLLLLESLLLGVASATLGVVIAYVLGGIGRRTLLTNVEWADSAVDSRVLLFSIGVAMLAALVVGMIPAARAAATSLITPLKTGTGDGGGRRAALRTTLSIAQASLSVVLLVGAGLFVRSLWNAQHVRLGIDPDRVLVTEINRASLAAVADPAEKSAERTRRRQFFGIAVDRIAHLAGVSHAAVAVGMPFGNRFSDRVRVPGRDSLPRLSTGGPGMSAVSPDYFATVGTRIVRGRGFTTADNEQSARVAIVSQTMANVIWPNEDAIGKCIIVKTDSIPCAQIVGIAEDTHRSKLREERSMHFYIPFGQEVALGFGGAVLLVRGGDEPGRLVPAIRSELARMDGSITYAEINLLQRRIDPQMRPWKLGSSVLMGAGILALLVAIAGIYSVTSYLVTLRRREIGVRLALGASPARVLTLVLQSGFITSIAGIIIGSLVALSLGGFIAPLLFDESAHDPVVFGGVGFVLLVSALAACVVPAVKANRIDPIEVLRSD